MSLVSALEFLNTPREKIWALNLQRDFFLVIIHWLVDCSGSQLQAEH